MKTSKANSNPSLVCQDVGLYRRSADGTERAVLTEVSTELHAGEGIMISGVTGAGKSTLLHLFAGLLRPSEGRIIANGRTVSRWSAVHRDRWRRRIGIVFQQPHFLTELSVFENVVLPMVPRGNSLARLRRSAWEALEALGIRHLAPEKISELSGGEQQRVSIARALVCRPPILIADEPTAHQDDDGAAMIIDTFTRWKRPDTLTVVAAHDSRWERHGKYTDRHLWLEQGRLKEPQ